jgi:hypothetical protein
MRRLCRDHKNVILWDTSKVRRQGIFIIVNKMILIGTASRGSYLTVILRQASKGFKGKRSPEGCLRGIRRKELNRFFPSFQ